MTDRLVRRGHRRCEVMGQGDKGRRSEGAEHTSTTARHLAAHRNNGRVRKCGNFNRWKRTGMR